MVEDKNNNDKNYEEHESLIKDYKTAIINLEALQKFSLTISNSEFLDFTLRAKEYAEREALSNKKKIPITDFFQKILINNTFTPICIKSKLYT